jgi:hypothetical protein
MEKTSTVFLQGLLVLAGISVLGFMLWLPPHEGRNAQATLFAAYFKDPFLAYVYLGSIPFFTALYQAFRVLDYIRRDETFLPPTLKALRTIRYCALATVGLTVGGVVYLVLAAGAQEDTAGGVMPGAFAAFVSLAAAAGAGVLESIIKRSADARSGK